MSDKRYRINVLGASVLVSTEGDPDYIAQLENRYKRAVEEVRSDLNLGDPLATAVMAGIFLADENFKLKGQSPYPPLSKDETTSARGMERVFKDAADLLDRALKDGKE